MDNLHGWHVGNILPVADPTKLKCILWHIPSQRKARVVITLTGENTATLRVRIVSFPASLADALVAVLLPKLQAYLAHPVRAYGGA